MLLFLHAFALLVAVALAGSKSKPHPHTGLIEPFSGRPISFHITDEQVAKLNSGEPVTIKERLGKSGRGIVIQDIHSTQAICMEKIRDMEAYPRMVPNVKNVKVYESKTFPNGSSQVGAEFDVGAMGLRFGYFLRLNHEPKHQTLTWTLDYKYNSDFDDNVGHWQVMPHPDKRDWSRVLFSTKVKLLAWIPEFVVNFITGKALIKSTTWLKREAEAEFSRREALPLQPRKNKWFFQGGSQQVAHSRDNDKFFERFDKFISRAKTWKK